MFCHCFGINLISITLSNNQKKKKGTIFPPFYISVSRLHYEVIPKSSPAKGWILFYKTEIVTLGERIGDFAIWEDSPNLMDEMRSLPRVPGKNSDAHKGRGSNKRYRNHQGESHWLNTSLVCFPCDLSFSIMKESVGHSNLPTKQWIYEKLTNSGINLYSGGIVSSCSPAFCSFFSLAFALKRNNIKKTPM